MKRALFLLLLIATPVFAAEPAAPEPKAEQTTEQKVSLSGKLFTGVYAPYKDAGRTPYRQVSGSLWLNMDAKLSESAQAHAELAGDRFETSQRNPSSGFETSLREGFASYKKNGWDLRAGRQIIAWGKADAINPTDFLSAKDYTFLNPEEELRRTGATSVIASCTPSKGTSPFTFTAVWTPVAPQSKLLVPTSAVPTGVTLAATQSPSATPANSELAFKTAYAASSWDVSLSAFKGYNHMPEYFLASTGGTLLAPVFTIAPTFHMQTAVGGDFSRAFESTILRAETAYVWTENRDGTNPLIQPSHWDAVVGVEKPFFTDFRVQAQLMWRLFHAYKPADQATGSNAVEALVNQRIAAANALLLNYQDPFRALATLRIGYNDPSLTWDAEVFAVFNFQGRDSLIRPKASYLWADALRTSIGMDRYAGPSDRPLGTLSAFNSIFAEAKYFF